MELTLIARKQEAPETVSLLFSTPHLAKWKPGQFLHYTLPHPAADGRGIDRFFTISSAPHEGNVMLTTRFAPKGSSFKKALADIPVGTVVQAEGPEGDFIVEDPKKVHVFIAGGIGITPFRAMIIDLDHRHEPVNATLLYGNRDGNFPFRDEFDAIAARHPEFHVRYLPAPLAIDEAAIREAAPDITDPLFYVSGPEPMVDSLEGILKGMGVSPKNIRTDFFPGYEAQ
jgi:ferredoxin-NADP reductase